MRELDEEQGDGVGVRGRNVAVGFEHARNASARDERASQFEIERRERQGLVVDDFDGGAAAAEYDDRAESRIVGNAGDQLARFRAQDHRMKR